MKTIRKLSTIDKKRKQIIRGTLDDEAKENAFKAAEKEWKEYVKISIIIPKRN